MRTVKASEFKAKCLDLIDQVAETGEAIVVTKRGHARVRVVPVESRPRSIIGLHAGETRILGDISGPLDVEWEANADPD